MWAVSAPGRTSSCCRAATRNPLFLQVKEATASVLEGHLPKSRYKQHGERVVCGQRMLQAASDIFLGWTRGQVDVERSYYWRQLRDMKGSAEVEVMAPLVLSFYAGICGWTLARAHARSGDPVAIAEYLGEDDQFDRSIVDFAKRMRTRTSSTMRPLRRRFDLDGWKRWRADERWSLANTPGVSGPPGPGERAAPRPPPASRHRSRPRRHPRRRLRLGGSAPARSTRSGHTGTAGP